MFWVNSSANNSWFFHSLKNVIDEKILKDLEEYVNIHNLLQPAKFISEGNDLDPDTRITEIAWIDTRTNSDLYSALTTAINKANNEYFDFSITYLETLQYSVYPEGGHYGCHTDGSPTHEPAVHYSQESLAETSVIADRDDPDIDEHECPVIVHAGQDD